MIALNQLRILNLVKQQKNGDLFGIVCKGRHCNLYLKEKFQV